MTSSATDVPVPRLRLAVVEDDDELREKIIVPALRAAGFEVAGLASALELYRIWAGSPFDLVLLDVRLPDDDGVEIARHLRGLSPSLGIVVYTGQGRSVDRMRGLRAGVDAYLVKPLEMVELVETLRNLGRRLAHDRAASPPAGSSGWSLDRRGWCLTASSGATISLSPPERQILAILVATPGKPVQREVLIAELTSDVEQFDPHRLEMLVYRLRKKCQDACGQVLPLRSVRGIGYALDW